MGMKHRQIIALTATGLVLVTLVGCGGQLDRNIATLNAAATAAASGGGLNVTMPSLPGSGLLTPQPTNPPNTYDLTIDPTSDLVRAWGQVYGLPSGSQFAIR